MKKIPAAGLPVLGLVLLLQALASCNSLVDPSFTLSGSLSKSGVADGVFGGVKVVTEGDSITAPALYWAETAAFNGGTAAYSISGIPPGNYSVYAFIDVNANAVWGPSAMPEAKDWSVTGSTDITIAADQILNYTDGEFEPVV